ncbi:MAG: hypothetical protein OHK93_003737 [Ramalina farinacea]|uniref:Uncharacterized protein n=1 Tax=Ramalina farinacea TaxID=258253 RepID=A0AA43QTV5_9LECA|nr:hypothetical protein [Ramalina farinacea]
MGMIFEDDEEDRMERSSEILPRLEAEAAESGHAPYWINLLDGFTGAQRAREEAHLHFRPIGIDHPAFSRDEEHPPLVCSQRLRHSIKQLVGFRKVVMVLEFVVKAGDIGIEAYGGYGRIRDQTIRSYVQLMADMNNAESFDYQDKVRFKQLTTEVGQDLETYLGPFTKHFVDRQNGDFAGIITYHPRKAPDTIDQKAAKDEEKLSQMMKAMTESSIG